MQRGRGRLLKGAGGLLVGWGRSQSVTDRSWAEDRSACGVFVLVVGTVRMRRFDRLPTRLGDTLVALSLQRIISSQI